MASSSSPLTELSRLKQKDTGGGAVYLGTVSIFVVRVFLVGFWLSSWLGPYISWWKTIQTSTGIQTSRTIQSKLQS
jgi:hypothetical protein